MLRMLRQGANGARVSQRRDAERSQVRRPSRFCNWQSSIGACCWSASLFAKPGNLVCGLIVVEDLRRTDRDLWRAIRYWFVQRRRFRGRLPTGLDCPQRPQAESSGTASGPREWSWPILNWSTTESKRPPMGISEASLGGITELVSLLQLVNRFSLLQKPYQLR
jgi:hypothetical protein